MKQDSICDHKWKYKARGKGPYIGDKRSGYYIVPSRRKKCKKCGAEGVEYFWKRKWRFSYIIRYDNNE